jgi:hypothetical protein
VFLVVEMDSAGAYHSDGDEFKVLRRGNRAVSEGRLTFVSANLKFAQIYNCHF